MRESVCLPLQDALLRLAAVVDVRSLRVALRDSVQELLPSTECVCIYVLEGDSRLLSDNPPHEVPQEGKIRNVVEQQKRCECAGLPPSELPEKYRISLAAPLPAHRRALVIPILDQDHNKVLAVLLVGCGPLSDQEELYLDVLGKHVSVACVRIQAVQASYQRPPLSPSPLQSHNALLHLNVSEQDYCELDRNILQLCGELYDLDAASLQLKVINYLQQQTKSQCCCLLLVSEDNHQLFCQVVGDKVLEEEISFPLMFGRFGQVVEKKKSISLQDISAEERRQLSSMLGCEISSMLCVPVVSRATGHVVALACAFNKQGGQRHAEADEHVIQHCFCYTSTVLTSTLAFQKEQKLKVECQALLQVAKNLFTHLDDVSVLLQEIIVEARNLSDAEICSVFLLDRVSHELVAKVFDGGVVSEEENEFRIPADQGIAGHVATTGQILNIKDAYSHPLFYRGVDDSTGFRTRNILCFPIKDENNEATCVPENFPTAALIEAAFLGLTEDNGTAASPTFLA
ncbi:cGMP-dependent 3',5'-cyclic phosphodiesterase [Crenichthys baileyi]|uniref:cGMP-dependent 3',5'-cyclic phosphodiesterase n=1 Tax=Crenichthys baileyi TaxID=28760 RepID=A0AAV9R9P0_9TELE